MATQPVDDSGNYTQPTTTAGPTKFTGVATANTPESATEQARQLAQTTAINTYGPLQTEFVSFDQTRIVINGRGTGPFTYTATVVTNAIQIPAPNVTGLTESQQAALIKENNELVGDDPISPEEQQQLEQAGTPEQINVPTPEQIAFNETNLSEPATIDPAELRVTETQALLEANVEPSTIDPAELRVTETQALLEANEEPATIDPAELRVTETQALLDANLSEPATIDPAELRVTETQTFLDANLSEPATIDPATIDTEFGDLEGAIRQQQNTQGLPVLNEDGTVAEGVKINPETGETYYTGTTPPTEESQDTGTKEARASGNNVEEEPLPRFSDWRFRISLAARNADYFYNVAKNEDILAPLKETNGVIYPYTPNISVTYNANYEPTDLAHTNYRIYNYKNSSVENITITGDFTAQDTREANYMLAVIHFFRCATKMFYGKDLNPIRGTPPPLCYLNGHGTYGFNEHPVAITNFTLNYPTDVDYINAGVNFGTASSSFLQSKNFNPTKTRLQAAKLQPGGIAQAPGFTQSAKLPPVTRVPTKLQITITCIPIVTRYDISNRFSLKEYATGKLLQGNVRTNKGIW